MTALGNRTVLLAAGVLLAAVGITSSSLPGSRPRLHPRVAGHADPIAEAPLNAGEIAVLLTLEDTPAERQLWYLQEAARDRPPEST